MTIAIKALRKAIAFHDAVTRVLDKLRTSLDIKRADYRSKLSAKVEKLVSVEYALQSKVINEPYELREKLNKEHTDLIAYFNAESDALIAQIREVDSEDNKAERAARLNEIHNRINELRKLVV